MATRGYRRANDANKNFSLNKASSNKQTCKIRDLQLTLPQSSNDDELDVARQSCVQLQLRRLGATCHHQHDKRRWRVHNVQSDAVDHTSTLAAVDPPRLPTTMEHRSPPSILIFFFSFNFFFNYHDDCDKEASSSLNHRHGPQSQISLSVVGVGISRLASRLTKWKTW